MITSIDNINLNDYSYYLPEDRIALFPAEKRDQSRLLVRKSNGDLSTDIFANLHLYLGSGSRLFFNNSKVIPARLIFLNDHGARIEIFCLKPFAPADYGLSLSGYSGVVWQCMVGNLKKFNTKTIGLKLNHKHAEFTLKAEKIDVKENIATIKFSWDNENLTFSEVLTIAGHIPLPPYIKRSDIALDRERYQTVYSSSEGSVAAPTAGLHFTDELFERIRSKNITCHEITLHVGAGTFQPIKKDNVLIHQMHSEYFAITDKLISEMLGLREKVSCVGTTTVRTLESLYWIGVKLFENPGILPSELSLGQWECYQLPGDISLHQSFLSIENWMKRNNIIYAMVPTSLMIVPGYKFMVTDNLITNFHQPGSTLLLLVAAFMGESWRNAYDYALDKGFRFLSYGDSSILLSE